MTVTPIIYGKPGCPGCDALKRHCRRKGVPYRYVDVTQDAQAKAFIQQLGYAGVPVLVIGDDHFYGAQFTKIDALAADQLAEAS